MTDKTLSLDDLRVRVPEYNIGSDGGLLVETRPFTRSDLEAVIRSEGGERHDDVTLQFLVKGQVIYTRDQGDYLILRLDDPTEEG